MSIKMVETKKMKIKTLNDFFYLTVDKKPEIINKNQTIVVQKGDRAVLPCNVTGFPGPSFTWDKASACSTYQRNGQPLVITNASLSSAGTYKCIAKNRAGTDWGEIKLIVNGTEGIWFLCWLFWFFLYLKRSDFCLFIFSETEICTFKSTEQCNWKNIQTGDNLDWVKQTGSTPSSQTGPSADHTNPNSIVPIHLLFVISIHEMIGVCVQCSFTCVLLLCMVFLHIVFTKIQ